MEFAQVCVLLAALLAHSAIPRVLCMVPACEIMLKVTQLQQECFLKLSADNQSSETGCRGMWDNLTCWPSAQVGEIVVMPCPLLPALFLDVEANVSRNCTSQGWASLSIPYILACRYNNNTTTPTVKEYCTVETFSNVAEYLWRLGTQDGGVLHMRARTPMLFIVTWTITRVHYDDEGCWLNIDSPYWWIIRAPILVSILVNFILFICIIRILVQKLHTPDVGLNDISQYSRLTKSTLLLIPLFGINYIVFAFFPDNFEVKIKLVFDLILGSFQGFIVAVLYCFLNGEVQSELKRKWRRWHVERYVGGNLKYHHPSMGSNGTNCATQVSMLTKCSPKTRSSSFQADYVA
ncbi:vasoactive intestinal polypeptide receptor [Rhincodon typus]|uniref:vasoactive intestinal polypeptide receptor n=1 Tax=Rhincodon typus TaxID=259920 RepID=UPI00202DF222|nr:vasoactive intestinal polypeptide receptor [Rhincodon typus]